ncbi:hypothetical protein BLNAU_14793 [Blattamonas nauphoetae]|uniref:Protein kinase domain-containing protein n=1 Tax=Blattamonas nauphoetae TaxID=2049346 RepID=A0ABQ9XCR7_9EUKA|nr:hypothetical protein BLNAU_14793 [Blattamonas nauphoetae]
MENSNSPPTYLERNHIYLIFTSPDQERLQPPQDSSENFYYTFRLQRPDLEPGQICYTFRLPTFSLAEDAVAVVGCTPTVPFALLSPEDMELHTEEQNILISIEQEKERRARQLPFESETQIVTSEQQSAKDFLKAMANSSVPMTSDWTAFVTDIVARLYSKADLTQEQCDALNHFLIDVTVEHDWNTIITPLTTAITTFFTQMEDTSDSVVTHFRECVGPQASIDTFFLSLYRAALDSRGQPNERRFSMMLDRWINHLDIHPREHDTKATIVKELLHKLMLSDWNKQETIHETCQEEESDWEELSLEIEKKKTDALFDFILTHIQPHHDIKRRVDRISTTIMQTILTDQYASSVSLQSEDSLASQLKSLKEHFKEADKPNLDARLHLLKEVEKIRALRDRDDKELRNTLLDTLIDILIAPPSFNSSQFVLQSLFIFLRVPYHMSPDVLHIVCSLLTESNEQESDKAQLMFIVKKLAKHLLFTEGRPLSSRWDKVPFDSYQRKLARIACDLLTPIVDEQHKSVSERLQTVKQAISDVRDHLWFMRMMDSFYTLARNMNILVSPHSILKGLSERVERPALDLDDERRQVYSRNLRDAALSEWIQKATDTLLELIAAPETDCVTDNEDSTTKQMQLEERVVDTVRSSILSNVNGVINTFNETLKQSESSVSSSKWLAIVRSMMNAILFLIDAGMSRQEIMSRCGGLGELLNTVYDAHKTHLQRVADYQMNEGVHDDDENAADYVNDLTVLSNHFGTQKSTAKFTSQNRSVSDATPPDFDVEFLKTLEIPRTLQMNPESQHRVERMSIALFARNLLWFLEVEEDLPFDDKSFVEQFFTEFMQDWNPEDVVHRSFVDFMNATGLLSQRNFGLKREQFLDRLTNEEAALESGTCTLQQMRELPSLPSPMSPQKRSLTYTHPFEQLMTRQCGVCILLWASIELLLRAARNSASQQPGTEKTISCLNVTRASIFGPSPRWLTSTDAQTNRGLSFLWDGIMKSHKYSALWSVGESDHNRLMSSNTERILFEKTLNAAWDDMTAQAPVLSDCITETRPHANTNAVYSLMTKKTAIAIEKAKSRISFLPVSPFVKQILQSELISAIARLRFRDEYDMFREKQKAKKIEDLPKCMEVHHVCISFLLNFPTPIRVRTTVSSLLETKTRIVTSVPMLTFPNLSNRSVHGSTLPQTLSETKRGESDFYFADVLQKVRIGSSSGFDGLIVWRGIMTRSLWEGSFESSSATQLWSEDTKHNIACSLLVYLRDIESAIQVGGSQHADIDDCGHFGVGCSTLGKGIARINSAVSTTTLTIASDLALDELISLVSEKEAILTRSAGVLFRRGQNGRFSLNEGKLEARSIAFTTLEAEFSNSFFTMTSSGSLSINNCSFVGFKSTCTGSIVCGSVSDGQSFWIDGSSSFSSCSGGDGGCINVKVFGSGSIRLGGSFSKCSSTGKGGALNLDVSGKTELTQISFDSLEFSTSDANSALEGSNMFVTSSSLSELATSEPFKSLSPHAQTALFNATEKNSFIGFESKDVKGSLLYFWYPHTKTAGSVHRHSSGEDHPNCGLSALPCSSLRHSMKTMKDEKTVTLDSSMEISGVFESTASEWTLTQSASHTFSLTKNGQVKVPTNTNSKLTLLSLNIIIKEITDDRTSPLLEVVSGSIRFSSCSIGDSGTTVPLTLCSLEGGSVLFEGDTTIVNPSPSHHLLRVVSGELTINSSLTITHSLSPRSVSLIDMTGGTTTIEDSLASIISSHTPLTLSGTARLVLDSVTDVFSTDLPTVVDQNGGSVTISSCSFSGGSLTGSFATSSGSIKIIDTQFSQLRHKSSSNGNQKRALTLTVDDNERVVIGDENKAVGFVDCSSDGDGGAMQCTVNGGGELSIVNASFSDCSSSGVGGGLAVIASENVVGSSLTIRAKFSSCSCGDGAKGDWIHLTGCSFEHLIVLDNWEVSQSSLSSPEDNLLLFGVDLAEEPTSSYKDITLLYYLIGYKAATIFVGSEGRDAAGCGQYEWNCRSVEMGVSHLAGHKDLNLVVVSETILSDSAVFGKNNVEVVSESGIEQITVSSNGQLDNTKTTSSPVIRISTVLFTLGEKSDLPLIVSSCGHVSIVSCKFEWTNDLPRPLASITGGEFTLSNLTFERTNFSTIPFIVASSDTLVVSSVSLSDCTGDVLLSVSNTKSVKMSSCQLDGVLPKAEPNSESLCSWSTGLITLENCKAVRMDTVQFYEQSQGGLFISNSNVTLHSCLFEHNSAGSERFPSANRNIRCEANGSITIPSVGMSNVEELGSQWISADSCMLSGAGANVDSPLFIADLKNKSSSVFHVKNKTMDVSIIGTVLIPCGLRLGVFEWDPKNEKETGNMMELDLTQIETSKWEENTILLTINQTRDLFRLNSAMEWRGRLLFGPAGRSSEWIRIRESDATIRKSQASKNMPWILGIVGGVLLMLLAVIIVLVLVRRCKKEKAKDEKKPMLTEMDGIFDDLKVEDDQTWPGHVKASTDNILGLIEDTDGRLGLKHIDDTDKNDTAKRESNQSAEDDPVGMMVEAVRCEGEFESVYTCKSHTLYSRLHGKHQGQELDAQKTAVLIVKGLQNSLTDKARREAFLRLTPNWILLDEKDGVLLQMRELSKYGEQTEQGNTTANHFLESGPERQSSGVRWASPEVVAGQSEVNHEKASVFSLGLILWEMETGQVPLREIDGVNAQRQLATGSGLVMTNIEEWKKGLIEKCISLDPDSRPTLKEIEQTLITSGKILGTMEENKGMPPPVIAAQNAPDTTG